MIQELRVCLIGLLMPLAMGQETSPSIPGRETVPLDADVAPLIEKVDPSLDRGWDSEVFSEAASAQLAQLAAMIEKGEGQWGTVIAPKLSSSSWRPEKLNVALEDRLVRVARGETETQEDQSIEDLVSELRVKLKADSGFHVKFKIIRIRMEGQLAVCEAIFQAYASKEEGVYQQNAVWECEWINAKVPLISRIRVKDYEEILSISGKGLHFEDTTAALLGSQSSYRGQLSLGADHWREHLQIEYGTDVNGLQGIALGDVNGDGWDDLYVCQPGGLPNRLYIRQPEGTLHDVSALAGVDWMELTRAALLVDLDNDGDQDLVLSQDYYYMLMSNDGSGKFTKRLETRAPAKLRSVAAADIEGDGDLDLYFCGRNPSGDEDRSVLGFPLPYHDANNGGPNVMLVNEGDWKFADKTLALGLNVNNRRFSFACSWEDYDNDGDQDLYVANDFGRNNLYRNDLNESGKFVDVARQLGVEDMSAGMSITWGDVNRDGWMDAYISNMFSSAGNRITYQRQFRTGNSKHLSSFQRHARGNTLFLNQQDKFEDVSVAANVTMGRWAWGAQFTDLNNDGWEDLVVANGFITTEDTSDL